MDMIEGNVEIDVGFRLNKTDKDSYPELARVATDKQLKISDKGDYWELEQIPEEDRNPAWFRVYVLKKKLVQTDYIVIKIQEAMITDIDTVDSLKRKYAQELEDRTRWREEINRLQEEYGLDD